jgi:hypothetical protein
MSAEIWGSGDPAVAVNMFVLAGVFQTTWLAAAATIMPGVLVPLVNPVVVLAAVSVRLPAVVSTKLENVAIPFTACTVVVEVLVKLPTLGVILTGTVLKVPAVIWLLY